MGPNAVDCLLPVVLMSPPPSLSPPLPPPALRGTERKEVFTSFFNHNPLPPPPPGGLVTALLHSQARTDVLLEASLPWTISFQHLRFYAPFTRVHLQGLAYSVNALGGNIGHIISWGMGTDRSYFGSFSIPNKVIMGFFLFWSRSGILKISLVLLTSINNFLYSLPGCSAQWHKVTFFKKGGYWFRGQICSP